MKREYKKPNMNTKRFVASEYVASCWTIECKGYIPSGNVSSSESHPDCSGYVKTGLSEEQTLEHYSLKKNNGHPSGRVVYRYDGHWEVEQYDRATPAHPNASV